MINRVTSWLFFLAFLPPYLSADDFALELVDADPTKGFNFPYVLRIPIKAAANPVLIVETNNTGVSDLFGDQIVETKEFAQGYGIGPSLANDLGMPLLMPVFPRTKQNWKIYTHALDRDTLAISEGELSRLDKQLLAMVEDARKKLQFGDVVTPERFLICGFSASGTFANRFAFLHPSSLLGVISGGVNGIPMLPISSISNKQLIYPVGISDLESLTGHNADIEQWKRLPQLIFMGALDENDATLYDDAFSEAERELVHEEVGRQMMPDRWTSAQSIYMQEGANTTFITYGNLGHGTNGRVRTDLINFARFVIRSSHE